MKELENKQIELALFMGFRRIDDLGKMKTYLPPYPTVYTHLVDEFAMEITSEVYKLRFHEQPDWIMPVVDKIKECGGNIHLPSDDEIEGQSHNIQIQVFLSCYRWIKDNPEKAKVRRLIDGVINSRGMFMQMFNTLFEKNTYNHEDAVEMVHEAYNQIQDCKKMALRMWPPHIVTEIEDFIEAKQNV